MAKTKILVLDDDRIVRWALSEALSGWGYLPVEVETVTAALESFETEIPPVALLDVNLPDGSGIAGLKAIKGRQPP
jgi:two-component system response regulator AtoC